MAASCSASFRGAEIRSKSIRDVTAPAMSIVEFFGWKYAGHNGWFWNCSPFVSRSMSLAIPWWVHIETGVSINMSILFGRAGTKSSHSRGWNARSWKAIVRFYDYPLVFSQLALCLFIHVEIFNNAIYGICIMTRHIMHNKTRGIPRMVDRVNLYGECYRVCAFRLREYISSPLDISIVISISTISMIILKTVRNQTKTSAESILLTPRARLCLMNTRIRNDATRCDTLCIVRSWRSFSELPVDGKLRLWL